MVMKLKPRSKKNTPPESPVVAISIPSSPPNRPAFLSSGRIQVPAPTRPQAECTSRRLPESVPLTSAHGVVYVRACVCGGGGNYVYELLFCCFVVTGCLSVSVDEPGNEAMVSCCTTGSAAQQPTYRVRGGRAENCRPQTSAGCRDKMT